MRIRQECISINSLIFFSIFWIYNLDFEKNSKRDYKSITLSEIYSFNFAYHISRGSVFELGIIALG